MLALVKGIILGFAVAAPVGPVNLLCMRRTLVFGKKAGLVSGLGSALADTFFAIVAAFGFTAISHFLAHYKTHIHVFGGVILFIIAWRIYKSIPVESQIKDASNLVLWKHFFSSFLLTLTNPATVFSFIALFAGAGVRQHSTFVVVGIFMGSMAWWTILTYGIAKLKISHDKFAIVNKVAAVLIAVLGIISFLM
jgi:threonine/homoserine/homoserine lactone efflux protein